MTQSNIVDIDKFAADSIHLSPSADKIRHSAKVIYEKIGLPSSRRGNEKWKYTNIAPIISHKYEIAESKYFDDVSIVKNLAAWDSDWLNVVFVNGYFSNTLSDEINGEIVINTLSEVLRKEPADSSVFSHLGKYIDLAEDGFAALNTTLMSDGAVISIPKQTNLDRPINLIFYSDGKFETIVNPRVLVVAEKGSSASIIESYVGGSNKANFTNSVSEIYVGESATIRHYRLMDEGLGSYHVGYGRVVVHGEGDFSSRAFFKGAKLGRYDLEVQIVGDGGSCDLQGLYFTSDSQHVDNFINIDHKAPNGTSNLFYKGILDGKSRAVFGGTVFVRKEAQKTDSVQTDKNLLLSSTAEVDSKPALFIYADDVKCAHGATAGNIDQDTVFYMRSRGIDLEEASRLLIYGFAEEIINTVEIESLRNYLQNLFISSLPKYKFEF